MINNVLYRVVQQDGNCYTWLYVAHSSVWMMVLGYTFILVFW